MAGALARGVAFGLLTLAVVPFVLVAPAHATDDNTVSITVDQNAELKPTGNFYKATTNVTVKTGKPYGFNLTMQADTADLVNSKDSTHKISATPSTTPVALNANQWGYSLNKSATTFSAVPAGAQATPAVVADVTKVKPADCTNLANCTKQVTFAANVDPVKLASGSYSTTVTYTATAKTAPKPTYTDWPQRKVKTDPSDICRSGDKNSSCLVDLDPSMIPVIYNTETAEWKSVVKPENTNKPGEWYNYGNKQWANAVTVKNPQEYKGQAKSVKQSDILGFWVYIPRYTYEVMRRDGTDKPVSAQNFDIKFENIKTPKKRPLACKTKNYKNKDYRTQCGVSRELPLTGGEVSTWTTHPAFSFGKKELNGIWFAKFETTGTTAQPTVLPNERHISGEDANRRIGTMYAIAKSLGVEDIYNEGGDSFVGNQNTHNLAKLSSRMVNNNDWGAATYLSASRFGSGVGGVQINSQEYQAHKMNGKNSTGITGCGPYASYNVKDTYSNGGDLGTQEACSKSNKQRAYNGTLGQLASTTNNLTGIYDMSGGAWEYVAASYSDNLNNSNTNENFSSAAHPPYVNTYNITNINSCNFATCGGQALYETNKGTGGRYGRSQWNSQYMNFIPASLWLKRGSIYYDVSDAGLFSVASYDGYAYSNDAFRVALAPTVQN